MSDTQKKKAILYTDGGYRQQYTSGGWGVHGYTYTDAVPDKGTGNPKCIPTAEGYAQDKGAAKLVTIENYIDGVGGVPNAISNNHTELQATVKGLEWIVENGIHHTKVFTDSRYVVDGLTKWVSKWERNNWTNSQGNPVTSKDLWLTAKGLMEKANGNGQQVQIQWIKGHDGHFGNEMADQYASRGNVLGRKGMDFSFMLESPPAGYWNKKNEYSRLLSSGRWYFQTTDEEFKTKDGKTIYYIGEHGESEDETHGKRVSDNSNTVLYLNEPDPVLEQLRQQAMELDVRKFGSVMIGRLDTILSPNVYSEIMEHGTKFVDFGRDRKDMSTAKRRPVVKEQNPPGLSYIGIDVLSNLQGLLDSYLERKPGIWITDITDLIYDVEVKKNGVTRKVKKEISSSTKHLDVAVRYSTKKVSEVTGEDDPSVKEKKVRLIFGIDLAKRNTLSNIANDDVKVSVITWRESDAVIRYATIIETSAGTGIWAGTDSNYLMV